MLRLLTLLGAALMVVPGVIAPGDERTALAQEPAQITVRAPAEEVDHDADEIVVPVEITGVENLGAFLFVMTYDSDVAEVKDVRTGPFLGSSGREVNCEPPVLQDGEFRYFCVTLRPSPAGAEGSGVLAEIVFEPNDGGTTELTLTRAQITDPTGAELPSSVSGATLRVEEAPGFPLLLVIGVGVAGGIVLLVVFEVVRRMLRSRRSTEVAA
jgi:hypothetical protein